MQQLYKTVWPPLKTIRCIQVKAVILIDTDEAEKIS